MDSKAIVAASTDDLKGLGFTAVGDIISLKTFCENPSNNIKERKTHLLEILQQGKGKKPTKKNSDDGQSAFNATKKVYIGWIHQETPESKPKQVRPKQGGGVREQNLSLVYTKNKVLQSAIPLFFPDGHSTLGKEKDMQFLLSCYNGEEIGDIVKLPSGEEVPIYCANLCNEWWLF